MRAIALVALTLFAIASLASAAASGPPSASNSYIQLFADSSGICGQDPAKCTMGISKSEFTHTYVDGPQMIDGTLVEPTVGTVISVIGDCRGGDCQRLHQGIDIQNKVGTAIFAAADGIAKVQEEERGNCGVSVRINHDKQLGSGLHTVYCHLEKGSLKVKNNQQVRAGQWIASMGKTGNARDTVPHLHFEVRRGQQVLNPCSFYGCIRGSTMTMMRRVS